MHQCPEYEQPLCRLISLCRYIYHRHTYITVRHHISFNLADTFYSRYPFLKEKASDETMYAPAVVETLVMLGRVLLCTSSRPVCEQTATSLATLYSHKDREELREDVGGCSGCGTFHAYVTFSMCIVCLLYIWNRQ